MYTFYIVKIKWIFSLKFVTYSDYYLLWTTDKG